VGISYFKHFAGFSCKDSCNGTLLILANWYHSC